MQSKMISQQSQQTCVDSVLVTDGKVSDLIVLIESWGCDEKRIVSDILSNDMEYVELQDKIDRFKYLVIEKVICNLDKEEAQILTQYIKLMKEQFELVKDTADMITNDLVNASR